MAVLAFAQPGQILVLTEGPRHDLDNIRENVLAAGNHLVALYGNYPPHLEAFRDLAHDVSSDRDVRDFVTVDMQNAMGSMEDARAIVCGFYPGGNPTITSMSTEGGSFSLFIHYPQVVADLSPSVFAYLHRNLYSPFMTHEEGLDFIVLAGLQYAELFRKLSYADGIGVARLRVGTPMEWLSEEELEASTERARCRLRAVARLMSGVLSS